MGLSDAAREARAKADANIDPGDHAVANALEAAEAAEADDQLAQLREPPDPNDYFPPPPVSHILIARPGT